MRSRTSWPELTPVQRLVSAAFCLVVALLAQLSLDRQQGETMGVLLYGLAAVVFALAMRGTAIEAQAGETDTQAARAPSTALLASSLGIALLGCLDFGGNRFRPFGTVLWIGGLLVAFHHLSQRSAEMHLGARLKAWWRRRGVWVPIHWLILIAIVLVGGWFRLYRLHEIPADLGPDLVYHYYNTVDILQGQYRVNFLERGSLLFYLTALCARLIGMSPFTLFFTSALIGTGTIVAMYALGAELFGPQIGLLAALLLAINRWHLTLSRSAYPAVQIPVAVILVLYTLARALRRRQSIDFACCGLQVGLGFYTWTPYKAMPLFVILSLALYGLARGRARLRSLLPGLLLLFAVAVVVAAPMLRYAVENPHEYFVREEVALRLKRERADQDPGLPTYFWRTLLGLNYMGDATSRWNYPLARHMGFVSGPLMVLGLAYALWRWRNGYNFMLLSAWFVFLLPAALGMLPHELANTPRMSGMLGPAVLLAALPLPLVGQVMRQVWAHRDKAAQNADHSGDYTAHQAYAFSLTIDSASWHYAWTWRPHRLKRSLATALALTAVVGLLCFEARETHQFYFRDFVSAAPDRMNYSNAREIAREIEHYGHLDSVYVKLWPFWFDSKALWANLGMMDNSWQPWVTTLNPEEPPLSTVQGAALFIVHADDQEGLATLRAFFPRGVAIMRTYPDGIPAFYAFYVER